MDSVGDMNHYLTVQKPDNSKDGSGYSDVRSVWAEVKLTAANSPEALRFDAPTAVANWTMTMHYAAGTDIRAEWRLFELETGMLYQIQGYGDPDGSRTFMQFSCRAVQ